MGVRRNLASLTAAYAALPKQKKADIEELIAEHSIAHSRAQISPNLMDEAFPERYAPGQSTLGAHHP